MKYHENKAGFDCQHTDTMIVPNTDGDYTVVCNSCQQSVCSGTYEECNAAYPDRPDDTWDQMEDECLSQKDKLKGAIRDLTDAVDRATIKEMYKI